MEDVVGPQGYWSSTSDSTCDELGVFSDINDPNSFFSGSAGTYTLTWTILDRDGNEVCNYSVEVIFTNCEVIDFDGVDDYITFKDEYDLGNEFSLEVWIKPEDIAGTILEPVANEPLQTILSKRNGFDLNEDSGYDLRLVNDKISFNWNSSGSIESPALLKLNGEYRWYHVAVTFDGNLYTMYIDGIEVASTSGNTPNPNSRECMIGAMDQTGNPPNKQINHFSGWIDELRIWQKELDPEHIHQMMNQEINPNASAVVGSVITTMDVKGPDVDQDGVDDDPLYWTDLLGYYRMDDISCGYLLANYVGKDGKIRNITTEEEQTAPLPYESDIDGVWNDTSTSSPWIYGGTVWDHPNSTGINGDPIDWNIVRVSNNITSGDEDITLLGLLVESGELSIWNPNTPAEDEFNSGHMLWITQYLLLNGSIDLWGESQLLQKKYGIYGTGFNVYTTYQYYESILDDYSGGFIERDQQGQANRYNYDDWSSPVGLIGEPQTALHSVFDVMKDGQLFNDPQDIIFIQQKDGIFDQPIKISKRWLYAYKNFSNSYSNWLHINDGYAKHLAAGEGYTMKGAMDPDYGGYQNYVFVGKPHNANVALNLSPANYYLTGNPYPSALDADQFIIDNLDSTTGVLLLYEDWGDDETHVERKASAGYATYTIAGGVGGDQTRIKADNINNPGEEGLTFPERYLPVGQAFWVEGSADGGPIKFNNLQRDFVTENSAESVYFKESKVKKKSNSANNIVRIPIITEDTRFKIRLAIETPELLKKQLLLTFDERSSDYLDKGFDGVQSDILENDIYWFNDNNKLKIQAVKDYYKEREVPLGLNLKGNGTIIIKVDSIENPFDGLEIYLRDNLTLETFDILNGAYEIELEAGEYNERYSVVFEPKVEIPIDIEELWEDVLIFINNSDNLLSIRKPEEIVIDKVSLFNVIGQQIRVWNTGLRMNEIDLPINVARGAYLVILESNKGRIFKKVVIK
jgi:hypothetical protein